MTPEALESDVLLARGGDHAAFTRLVGASANTVCSIALAIVRDVPASEDIAQETFLAAWKDLGKLKNPASFLPWVRQVARNQARLWHRSQRRQVNDEARLAAAVDPRPDPDQSVIEDEEQRVLSDVIDQLPDDAREILILYYREGSSSSQVAALLGLSEAAVRQRISRGRAIVREEMLQRFGRVAMKTAPAAAFATVVAASLTTGAPAASAAVASAGVKAGIGAKAAIGAASLAGGVVGWFGVLLGMKYLEPVFDEEEGRELRAFRNQVLALVTFGCAAIATLATVSMMWMAIMLQCLYVAIGTLYVVRLPRILQRRMEWEQSVNPEIAKQNRRQYMWATMSRAVMAAIAGVMIMASIIMGRL